MSTLFLSGRRHPEASGSAPIGVDSSKVNRRHSSGSEAPPKGSTPVKLIVDT